MSESESCKWTAAEQCGSVTVVSFVKAGAINDELREAVADEFRQHCRQDGTRLLVDFSGVEGPLPGSLIGTLIWVWRKVEASGGRFGVCSLSPQVAAAFYVTRLDREFGLFESRREGVSGLKQPVVCDAIMSEVI